MLAWAEGRGKNAGLADSMTARERRNAMRSNRVPGTV
jgi:hypothetical protein